MVNVLNQSKGRGLKILFIIFTIKFCQKSNRNVFLKPESDNKLYAYTHIYINCVSFVRVVPLSKPIGDVIQKKTVLWRDINNRQNARGLDFLSQHEHLQKTLLSLSAHFKNNMNIY